MNRHRNAISLVELLVGLVLVGLVMLGLSNIETFSRSVFFNTDRKIKVQNDVALVLQHMQKFVSMGISNETQAAFTINATGELVQVWIDDDNSGSLGPGDVKIAYALDPATHKVYNYPAYVDLSSPKELLASNIETFRVSKIANNSLQVNITGRGNVDASLVSRDNPMVNLTTVIILPLVALD